MRFSAITYHWLNEENVTGEQQGVFLYLCHLLLDLFAQEGGAIFTKARLLLDFFLLHVIFQPDLCRWPQQITLPAATGRDKASWSFNKPDICREEGKCSRAKHLGKSGSSSPAWADPKPRVPQMDQRITCCSLVQQEVLLCTCKLRRGLESQHPSREPLGSKPLPKPRENPPATSAGFSYH